MPVLEMQPVRVSTGSDEEGLLIFLNGKLVAVLARLVAECHGDLHGS